LDSIRIKNLVLKQRIPNEVKEYLGFLSLIGLSTHETTIKINSLWNQNIPNIFKSDHIIETLIAMEKKEATVGSIGVGVGAVFIVIGILLVYSYPNQDGMLSWGFDILGIIIGFIIMGLSQLPITNLPEMKKYSEMNESLLNDMSKIITTRDINIEHINEDIPSNSISSVDN
jgi:hypothetical protein